MMITEADAPRLLPAFRGKKGLLLFRLAMKITGLDKANLLHDRVEKSGAKPGADFAHGLLEDCGIDFAIGIITDIQWYYADGIPGNQESVFLRIIEREGEDAAQLFQEIRSLVAVQGKDDLAVAPCLEVVLPGITAANVLMIIDFTVHGQNQLPVRGKQGLTTRFRVHDAQSLVR